MENVTEAEQEEIKKTLVSPLKIIGAYLYHCRVFKTEKSCYLFLDIHHTISDGTSYNVILGDIDAAYNGKTFPQKDCYYEILRERERMTSEPFYMESKEYFEKNYSGEGYDMIPKPDIDSDAHTRNVIVARLDVPADKVEKFVKATKLSNNGFFIAAALLAMAEFNRTSIILFITVKVKALPL